MKNIIDYEIHADQFHSLSKIIKEKIKGGWQPFGKMVVANKESSQYVNVSNTQYIICIQTIVKYEH